MVSRGFRLLLSGEESDDEVVLSREQAADLLRRLEALEKELRDTRRENQRLQRELERLRPALDKAREKSGRLTDQAEGLKEQLGRLQNSLPVLGASSQTAPAVGVPSSRTFFRQSPPPPNERRSTGGQRGHKGTTRPRPTPNSPPVVLALTSCPECTHTLGTPSDDWSHPITDLPPPGLSIFDLTVLRYKCPGCGKRVHAPIPEGYRGDFGPHLKAFVAELRVLGMPVEKIAELLEGTFGLEVSVASLLAMEKGVAESLDPTYQELKAELQDSARSPYAQGDETSMPVNGANEWVWVGTNPHLTVYHIDPTRGKEGAKELWGGYRGTMTHDGWLPYDTLIEATHQLDLVHANRWIQKGEARYGIAVRGLLSRSGPRYLRRGRPPREFLRFAMGVRSRLAGEVRWAEAHPGESPAPRDLRCRRAMKSMRQFLARPWRDEEAVRVQKALTERLDTLYTFVRIPGTSWNSNDAEREVRVAVTHRKIGGGRKTKTGARVLERLLTVWRTWKKRELKFWDVVMEKLGTPQLRSALSSSGPAS